IFKKLFLYLAILVLISFFIIAQQENFKKYKIKYKIEYFINDYSGLLSEQEILEIEPILKEIYDSKIAEYSIVIINSTEGIDIESFSYNLAEGSLGNKEKNNGLLLLIVLDDKKYRFEVGRGLEPLLPDVVVARIGRKYIEENFKNGFYKKGLLETSLAIKEYLFNNTEGIYFKDIKKEVQFEKNAELRAFIILIILIIIAILIIYLASKNTRPIKKRDNQDYFTSAYILSTILRGGKNSGGFGGGSFGGGGFSGRW
ncbi:MAG: TPM domain-containing protein, partial [Candidatus Woesearchaeota archaeon]